MDIVTQYTQLGIAGATLFLVLIFITLLFKFMNKDNDRVSKLCDKIDSLITSYHNERMELNKVLLCNDKDQKETLKLLDTILRALLSMDSKVSKIDERTRQLDRRKDWNEGE